MHTQQNRGSLLVYLTEAGAFGPMFRGRYPHVLQFRLQEAFKRFGVWKSENNLKTVTQARFTCARLNRYSRGDYPCLQSKGIAGKRLSFWLCEEASAHAERAGASELDVLVAKTATYYRNFLKKLDEHPLILTEEQANEIFKLGQLHLLSYAKLRKTSAQIDGAHAQNRALWALAPKHHYMMHVLFTMKQTKVNCRFYTLLAAEGFVGDISKIARMCHRANVSKRVLQRYKAKLGLELRKQLRKKR